MGFLWSMREQAAEPTGRWARTTVNPFTIELRAEVDGRVVAEARHTRLAVAPDVTRHVVRDKGLNGVFFAPPGDGPFPAIMLLSGSGGGLSEPQAALYASHGYAALALAYFRGDGLPDDLLRIPLEYFETAIAWLQARPEVDRRRMAVGGGSRGGELSLLLGSRYPVFRAVVATVPSAVVYGAVTSEPGGHQQPAWTWEDEGIPYLHSRPGDAPEYHAEPGVGFALTPVFLRSLEDKDAARRASIPVEMINGPAILISGKDDAMWPSSVFSEMVMERLAEHHHPWPDVHLSYERVGHLIGQPWGPTTVTQSIHPVTKTLFAYGGAPRDSAHANADAWPKILAFLDANLRDR
jgi:esterase/lipase